MYGCESDVLDERDDASLIGPMVPSCLRENESPGRGCFAMLDGRFGWGGGVVFSVGFATTDCEMGGVGVSGSVGGGGIDDWFGGLKPSEIAAEEKSKSTSSPSPSPTSAETLAELRLESLRSKSDAFEFPGSMAATEKLRWAPGNEQKLRDETAEVGRPLLPPHRQISPGPLKVDKRGRRLLSGSWLLCAPRHTRKIDRTDWKKNV